jgi:hypothetical protein
MIALVIAEWTIWQLYYRLIWFSRQDLYLPDKELFRDAQEGIGRLGIGMLGLIAFAYALMRLGTAHPEASGQLKTFLKQTPWRYGRPLPWSSPRLLVQDAVVLAILTALMYWQSRHVDDLPFLAQPAIALTTFTLIRGLAVCVLAFSAAPWRAWGMIYLFPAYVPLLLLIAADLMSPGALLALSLLHLVLQDTAIEASLQHVSAQLFDIAPQPNTAERESKLLWQREIEFPTSVGAGHKIVGAPWNLLSPKWRPLGSMTRREGWLTAGLVGWVTAVCYWSTTRFYAQHDPLEFAVPVMTFAVICALVRLGIYSVAYTAPIKRLLIGRWIILREDRALVAPLCIVAICVAVFGVMLFDARYHFVPDRIYEVLIPLWASVAAAIALMMGPDLKEHKLTTTVSLRLNRSGNPKPKR